MFIFYLHFTWLHGPWNPQRIFERISILTIWQLVFFWGVKIYFGKLLLKWCIFRHGKIWFSQIMPFNNKLFSLNVVCIVSRWYFDHLWGHDIHKNNFCFHESIFQWQIKLISHRSEFWYLRRKPAAIFSKWIFFQNSLRMSWAI